MKNNEVKQKLESIRDVIFADKTHIVTSLVNLQSLINNIRNLEQEAPQNSEIAIASIENSVNFILSQPIFPIGEQSLQVHNNRYYIGYLVEQLDRAYTSGAESVDIEINNIGPLNEDASHTNFEDPTIYNNEVTYSFFLACLGCLTYILYHNAHQESNI